MVTRSKSEVDSPSWTFRNINRTVVIGCSVFLSFSSRHRNHSVQAQQSHHCRKNLINAEHDELIEPLSALSCYSPQCTCRYMTWAAFAKERSLLSTYSTLIVRFYSPLLHFTVTPFILRMGLSDLSTYKYRVLQEKGLVHTAETLARTISRKKRHLAGSIRQEFQRPDREDGVQQ